MSLKNMQLTCGMHLALHLALYGNHMFGTGASRLQLAPAVNAIHAALHAIDAPVQPVHAGLDAAQPTALAAVAASIAAPNRTSPEPCALPLAIPGACWCPHPWLSEAAAAADEMERRPRAQAADC